MKNYLKPYTACTKVEFESLLASESKGKGGGGHNGGFNPGCPPCPPKQPFYWTVGLCKGRHSFSCSKRGLLHQF